MTEYVDDGPGERRSVLCDAEGRPQALGIERASWRGRRALFDAVFVGRVTRVDRARRGAFVDLGLAEETGFLPLDAKGRARRAEDRIAVTEGMGVRARVRREASAGKGAVLALLEPAAPGAAVGLVAERRSPPASFDRDARDLVDAAFDEALAAGVEAPGGGRLQIEPTAALVAIDVDAGGRSGSQDPDAFAADLNIAAAQEACRQLRLRRLGGVVAIDFVSMRSQAARDRVAAALKRALGAIPRTVRFAPPNALDVALFALERPQTPLHEILLEPGGRKSAETLALEGLRAVERAAASDRGAEQVLSLPARAAAWLTDVAPFDWRDALRARGAGRVALEPAPAGAPDAVDVRPR